MPASNTAANSGEKRNGTSKRKDVALPASHQVLHLPAQQVAQVSSVHHVLPVDIRQGVANSECGKENQRVSVSRPSEKPGPFGSQAGTCTSLQFSFPTSDFGTDADVSSFSKKKGASKMNFSTDKSVNL